MRIDAEARANAEAIRITTVAQANAESIQKVNEAIKAGGESYFRYRQIEMIPEIAPAIAAALAQARLITISGDSAEGGAAQSATSNITSVIQTVLAAQLVSGSGMLRQDREAPVDTAKENGRQVPAASPQPPQPPAPPAKTGFR
jgi:flotillin